MRSNYKKLKNTWVGKRKEDFFVSYAVRGPMILPGLRSGLPIDIPLYNSPVKEPSTLNTRCLNNLPNQNLSSIL